MSAPELDPIDADALGKSLTGYEEIAIEQMFRKSLSQLGGSGTTALRALLFVAYKRDGMADVDAFRSVMLLPLKEVTDAFKDATTDEDEEGKG